MSIAGLDQLDNLTESLQRHLGLQQAQTFTPEDIAADALGRLLETRGDVSRLQLLWGPPETVGPDLVDRWSEAEHRPALLALRRVLDTSLVVQRRRDGVPKSFLPFVPEFITAEKVSTIYRDLGRSVVEGLWGRPGQEDLRARLKHHLGTWRDRHPLALVLAPLCEPKPAAKERDRAHLAAAIDADAALASWVDKTVTEDWNAWLRAAAPLSIDEQIETITGLIGLHLHVCLLRRLGHQVGAWIPPYYFAAVEAHGFEPACGRAAYNCFGFWRDRAEDALLLVARQAIQKLSAQDDKLRAALSAEEWSSPRIWAGVGIQGGGKSKRAMEEFQKSVRDELHRRSAAGRAPGNGEIEEFLVAALAAAFSTPSGVAAKVKDHLRGYGRAAGIVGPDGLRTRKRYQLDERSISLLARLHAHRGRDEVNSDEEDKQSVEALLDDLFERYGIVVTLERGRVKAGIFKEDNRRALQPLLRHFPPEEPMRDNRSRFDRRLDELRFVRRYSDASAVIHIP
jgi:hypothetical protein